MDGDPQLQTVELPNVRKHAFMWPHIQRDSPNPARGEVEIGNFPGSRPVHYNAFKGDSLDAYAPAENDENRAHVVFHVFDTNGNTWTCSSNDTNDTINTRVG